MKTKLLKIITLLLSLLLLTACGKSAASTEISEIPTEVNVTLEGGSGRAQIASPAELRYEDGKYTAVIVWSSSNYDFMIVDGEKYLPVNESGNSVFEIPIPNTNCTVSVQADTTAMSTPHLIDYTLVFGGTTVSSAFEASKAEETAEKNNTASIPACLNTTGEVELKYAEQFSIINCDDGSRLLIIAGKDQFLLLPEGCARPDGLSESVVSLNLPLTDIYIASSSVMDMFFCLNALNTVSMCGTSAESWSIPEIAEAMASGEISYCGKYSAPDYESLLASGCRLALENTMIYHSPEVKEQLETLGIPVMVEHSSYEQHPLGRLEWIRLYGILTGHETEAETFFEESCRTVENIEAIEATGKTAAFFSVSTGGYAVVRSPNDYVVKMIEMAGGHYLPDDIEVSGSASTLNLQTEAFYAAAKDADFLIYNGTIEGSMYSMSELDKKSPLFSQFKAVKEGNVWCTEQSVFQQSTAAAEMIAELHLIFTDAADNTELSHFHKIN